MLVFKITDCSKTVEFGTTINSLLTTLPFRCSFENNSSTVLFTSLSASVVLLYLLRTGAYIFSFGFVVSRLSIMSRMLSKPSTEYSP